MYQERDEERHWGGHPANGRSRNPSSILPEDGPTAARSWRPRMVGHRKTADCPIEQPPQSPEQWPEAVLEKLEQSFQRVVRSQGFSHRELPWGREKVIRNRLAQAESQRMILDYEGLVEEHATEPALLIEVRAELSNWLRRRDWLDEEWERLKNDPSDPASWVIRNLIDSLPHGDTYKPLTPPGLIQSAVDSTEGLPGADSRDTACCDAESVRDGSPEDAPGEETPYEEKHGLSLRLLVLSILMVLAALYLAGSLLSPQTAQAQPPQNAECSGIAVEVVGDGHDHGHEGGDGHDHETGDITDAGALFVVGDYVFEDGASATLKDDSGTTGTFTDGENATFSEGAAGLGIIPNGEPHGLRGGSQLGTDGLRAVSSSGIEEGDTREAVAPARADADDPGAEDPGDAGDLRRQIQEKVDQDVSDAGIPDASEDTSHERQSPQPATDEQDAGTSSSGTDPAPRDGAAADSEIFDECFPFCEEEDAGGGDGAEAGEPRSDEPADQTSDSSADTSTGDDRQTARIEEQTTGNDEQTTGNGEQTSDGASTGDVTDSLPEDGLLSGGGLLEEVLQSPAGEGTSEESRTGDEGAPQQTSDEAETPVQDDPPAEEETPETTETPSGTSGGSPQVTGRGAYCGEDFGGVQPHVAEVGCIIFDEFGVMDYSGYRPGDPQDHGKGLALDFMTYDDIAKGDAIVDFALANQGEFAITYVIWQQQINFGSGWEMMEDRGNDTENHIDHPHLSFAP